MIGSQQSAVSQVPSSEGGEVVLPVLHIFTHIKLGQSGFNSQERHNAKLWDNEWRIGIDGHVCWNSKRRLLFIFCWPRKTNFHFPFTINKRGGFPFLFSVCSEQTKAAVFCIYIYIYQNSSIYIYIYMFIYIHLSLSIYIYIYIYWYMCCSFERKMENGSPGNFPYAIYCLLIVQTEVCCLSVCLQRNKRKLSVCKRTKRIWPSMQIGNSNLIDKHVQVKIMDISLISTHIQLYGFGFRVKILSWWIYSRMITLDAP
jgi:hypothetical protein